MKHATLDGQSFTAGPDTPNRARRQADMMRPWKGNGAEARVNSVPRDRQLRCASTAK